MNTVGPDHEQEEDQQHRGDRVRVREVLDAILDAGDGRDARSTAVSTAMTATASHWLRAPLPKTLSRPPVICSAPRPREVAEPNSVAKIATTSIALPGPCVGALPEERPEGRGDQVAGALAVGEVADRQADHGVHRPGVEAPVEERVLHRQLGPPPACRARARPRMLAVGGVEVGQRLGDAGEHEADAHAGGEHHGDPGERRELRLGVVGPELDVAVAGDREVSRRRGGTRRWSGRRTSRSCR